MLKENLDKRICDCEDAENTQTYREFISESEEHFRMKHLDLDNMDELDLQKYLNFIDCLWDK